MRKYYALIIKNALDYDVDDDVRKFSAYLKDKQDIELSFDVKKTNFDLKHKDFGVKIQGGDAGEAEKTSWGLDGIKEQIRQTNLMLDNQYHAVFFLYDVEGWDYKERPLGAWAYPNALKGSAFAEIPSTKFWEEIDGLFRLFTHENIHLQHRLCWWKGITTRDTMDRYDKEFDVFAEDGNRARNLAELEPHIEKFTDTPLAYILAVLGRKKAKTEYVPPEAPKPPQEAPEPPKLTYEDLAGAIKIYEGWFPPGIDSRYINGSRSFRNNNPGNLKFARQAGAVDKDSGGFAIFDSYQAGWDALIRQLKMSAHDPSVTPSRYYSPEMSLVDFFKVYAPSRDNNDPVAYALFVAQRLNVDPQWKIGELRQRSE